MNITDAIAQYKIDYPLHKIRNKSTPLSISLDDEASCFEALANLLLPNGIIDGLDVSIDGSNNIIIQPGSWRIDRLVYSISSVTTIPLDAQDVSLSRYDVVYADSNNQIHMVSGDLSVSPIEPAIPDACLKICSALITPTNVTIGNPFPTDYVDTITNQIVGGTKTFVVSPQVPTAVNPNDVVPLNQLTALIPTFGNGVTNLSGNQYGIGGSLSRNTTIIPGAFSLGITGRFQVSGAPVNPTDVLRLMDVLFPDTILTGLGAAISGSNVIVASGTWRISNVIYSKGTSTSLALDAQDATLSRFDLVYADTSNGIHLLSGLLSLSPDVPAVPNNTIPVAIILITPTSVTSNPVTITDYVTTTTDQNVGGIKTFTNKIAANKLSVAVAPVNPTDAARLQDIQLYLPLTGGNLTGALNTTSNILLTSDSQNIGVASLAHTNLYSAIVYNGFEVHNSTGGPGGSDQYAKMLLNGFLWANINNGHSISLALTSASLGVDCNLELPGVSGVIALQSDVTAAVSGNTKYFAAGTFRGAGSIGSPYALGLASVTGINGKATGAIALYTVPTGKTAIITGIYVRVTAITAISAGPSADVGVTAGDIVVNTAMALTTAGKVFPLLPVGVYGLVAAGSVINLNINTGATGTSQTLAVEVFGYLV